MSASPQRWRVPEGQRFTFEEFDDGILLFDERVGGTHLVSPTAAETLEVVAATPDLSAAEIRARVVASLELGDRAPDTTAFEELLERLADLCMVTRSPAPMGGAR